MVILTFKISPTQSFSHIKREAKMEEHSLKMQEKICSSLCSNNSLLLQSAPTVERQYPISCAREMRGVLCVRASISGPVLRQKGKNLLSSSLHKFEIVQTVLSANSRQLKGFSQPRSR